MAMTTGSGNRKKKEIPEGVHLTQLHEKITLGMLLGELPDKNEAIRSELNELLSRFQDTRKTLKTYERTKYIYSTVGRIIPGTHEELLGTPILHLNRTTISTVARRLDKMHNKGGLLPDVKEKVQKAIVTLNLIGKYKLKRGV